MLYSRVRSRCFFKISLNSFLRGLCILLGVFSCVPSSLASWNNPYPRAEKTQNSYYSTFSEQPKTLDPARAYSQSESIFISQIYEPLLQYHYLKEPYQLIPLTVVEMPRIEYFDKYQHRLKDNSPSDAVDATVFTIGLKKHIHYQPHPAFAKDKFSHYRYHCLPPDFIRMHGIKHIGDFEYTGERLLTVDDYIYEIKRLANPQLQSPIYGLMASRIVGLKDLYDQIRQDMKHSPRIPRYLDLRQYEISGVKKIDDTHFSIRLRGKDPHFIYWLAMNFFAPVPWEADVFYSNPGMDTVNLNMDSYPIGTGPYYLSVNNPNEEMRLTKNPEFHFEAFPTEGTQRDKELGVLERAGQRLPFIDEVIFRLEKESIPRWTKFLQGYYDSSPITSDAFDQAVVMDRFNNPVLSSELLNKKMRLRTSIEPVMYYFGFNMLDPDFGGNSLQHKKLRQAISIAMDIDEYIHIFLNGRGLSAQSPIPPGIWGYSQSQDRSDTTIYRWVNGHFVRRDIQEAKRLLREAGYPNGIDPKTGQPLIIRFDAVSGSSVDEKSQYDWFIKQFKKLGIVLQVEATTYNRFQDKTRDGNLQFFANGWVADYPDPENFLFLFYGKNSKVKHSGENTTNYSNPQYDALFEKMQNMGNGPERAMLIKKMVKILQEDAPAVGGFYPQTYLLAQQWSAPSKLNSMVYNNLKYQKIDPYLRAKYREDWNHPILWPFVVLFLIGLALMIPLFRHHYRMEHKPRDRISKKEL